MARQNGQKFSAHDKDVDVYGSNCAKNLKVDGGMKSVTIPT